MSLVAAKCTQCGGNIEIDSSKEAGICSHCGTAFITEKAIINYNTSVSNTYHIENAVINDNKEKINNLLLRSKQFWQNKEYRKAMDYANKVLDLDPHNSVAIKIVKIKFMIMGRFLTIDQVDEIQAKVNKIDKKASLDNNRGDAHRLLENFLGITATNPLNSPINKVLDTWEKQGFESVLKLHSEYNGPSNVKGCYIATCVYGSYDCPEVWILRRYRDNKLSKSFFGKIFINVYYKTSPLLVKLFGKKKGFVNICHKLLNKKVVKLRNKGFEDSPYED